MTKTQLHAVTHIPDMQGYTQFPLLTGSKILHEEDKRRKLALNVIV
jgi:hypothetical protein